MPLRISIRGFLLVLFLFASGGAPALDLSSFSYKDQIGMLKHALTQGAESAVSNLAKENGYLGNDRVHILLPDSLQKTDRSMRKFGRGKYSDDLIAAMNRATEASVPEATGNLAIRIFSVIKL